MGLLPQGLSVRIILKLLLIFLITAIVAVTVLLMESRTPKLASKFRKPFRTNHSKDRFHIQVFTALSDVSQEGLYLEQPSSCLLGGTTPRMILFISSRPSSLDMRAAIRETWGFTAASCGIKIIFGFGNHASTSLGEDLQRYIAVENLMHGDILQSRTIKDGYKNQTALVLQFFSWAVDNCNSPLVAKGDDDTWANYPLLMPALKSLEQNYSFVAGYHFPPGTRVLRDPAHQQSLTFEERESDTFPTYASGMLYVFPFRVVPVLLQKASGMMLHWIDDVFITGDLIEAINEENPPGSRNYIQRINLFGHLPLDDTQSMDLCELTNHTMIHKINPSAKRFLYSLSCLDSIKVCDKQV